MSSGSVSDDLSSSADSSDDSHGSTASSGSETGGSLASSGSVIGSESSSSGSSSSDPYAAYITIIQNEYDPDYIPSAQRGFVHFSITNIGSAPIDLNAVGISGGGDHYIDFGADPPPQNIPAGASLFYIAYSPNPFAGRTISAVISQLALPVEAVI